MGCKSEGNKRKGKVQRFGEFGVRIVLNGGDYVQYKGLQMNSDVVCLCISRFIQFIEREIGYLFLLIGENIILYYQIWSVGILL